MNRNRRKNTGPKIMDQLTSTGRPIINTVSKGNTDTYFQNNSRRGGKGKDKKRLPELTQFKSMQKKGFRAIPTIPTKEELLASKPEYIPTNNTDGPYESIEEYLETHYRLLREDCLSPLREGIRILRDQTDQIEQADQEQTDQTETGKVEQTSNLRIYERISLVGILFASVGIVHRISFTPKPFERVHWSTSKRLLPGTLVVFTNDNFNTMKFGTVFDRSLERLEKTYDLQVDVQFQLEDAEFELPEGYIMVETTSSYFEAYRHVLNVLQELDPETLPFSEHIIDLDREIDPPEYLQKRIGPYKFDIQEPKSPRNFDIKGEWPMAKEINHKFHVSQYEALKRMLTRCLALVQGPPGTGKTYVGLKAVKVLLDNLPGPIVIACQTNHALDQFLEGIQAFEDRIVRLGSRSKSPRIIPCTLFKIRQEMKEKSLDFRPAKSSDIGRFFKEKDKITREMLDLCEEISSPFLKLDFIKEQGYLTDDQISSLRQDDWYVSGSSGDDNDGERDYIQEWLDNSIATTSSKQNDLDYKLNQISSEDSGTQAEEEEEEFDEDDVEGVEADFQGNEAPFASDYKFGHLRGEKYIRSDTYVRDNEIDDYLDCEDLWDIPLEYRVAIHNRWRRTRLQEVCNELKKLYKKYFILTDKIKTERIREDLSLLKDARVVGMTTTAAAKYHRLLMNMGPKIMIIEEAAETLEAHIVTALTPSTEHLILIGDHQQLRPNISVHDLEELGLNVSLFERLTKFLPFSQLTEQRRMRPPIRELLSPIYGDVLTDHIDVRSYPDVPGFCENLYFLDHTEKETHVPETMSKINEFEAHMCAKLSNYLVKGGTRASSITILSMYSGQRKLILKYLREDSRKTPELKNIRVSSVDGFQGEENDIILLSLVRSRDARYGIGFLGVSNRVCVALSRARHGLYIFGNANQLAQQSDLWSKVRKILIKGDLCGQFLDLYCRNHSILDDDGIYTNITQVGDFVDVPLEGGCSKRCGEIMDCGHPCPNICHTYLHDEINCQENCIKKFPCGHSCKKTCDVSCGKCEEMVVIKPTCGHSKEIRCGDRSQYRCMEKCSKKLKCGHQCNEECSSPVCTSTCRSTVTLKCNKCGHFDRLICSKLKEKKQEGCPFCSSN